MGLIMNEKIKQLLKNNEIYHDTHLQVDYTRDNSSLELLVKSVVTECLDVLGTQEDYWDHDRNTALLKKHFGIE